MLSVSLQRMSSAKRERVEFTRSQWADLVIVILLMATFFPLELTLGTGWWTVLLLALMNVMLVRIGIWIIPIWRDRR